MPILVLSTGAAQAFAWLGGLAVLACRWSRPISRSTWLVGAATGTAAAVIGPTWFRGTPYHSGQIMMAVCGLALVWLSGRLDSRTTIVLAGMISILGLGYSIASEPGQYLDVVLMHRAGADALAAGDSPWEGLSVPNGAPGAEGSIITGDPYPPVALVWYSVGDWISGDPRLGGVVAWVMMVAAAMTLKPSDPVPVVLLVTSPALPLLLWTGWTEAVTVALLVSAVALWRRPVASSVVLGASLASKQYMAVLTPILLAMRPDNAVMRRSVTLGSAVALALSGFALGEGYLYSIVGAYSDIPPRFDSGSLFGALALVGVSVNPPFWLGPIAAVLVAVRILRGRPLDGPAPLLMASASVLAALFVLGTQAFANYWFVVWSLILVGGSVRVPSDAGQGAAVVADPVPATLRRTLPRQHRRHPG